MGSALRDVLERRVRFELRGVIRIRCVEQVLDTEQNLYRHWLSAQRYFRNLDKAVRRACLTVIAGRHDFSSFRIDKHTVPEG